MELAANISTQHSLFVIISIVSSGSGRQSPHGLIFQVLQVLVLVRLRRLLLAVLAVLVLLRLVLLVLAVLAVLAVLVLLQVLGNLSGPSLWSTPKRSNR